MLQRSAEHGPDAPPITVDDCAEWTHEVPMIFIKDLYNPAVPGRRPPLTTSSIVRPVWTRSCGTHSHVLFWSGAVLGALTVCGRRSSTHKGSVHRTAAVAVSRPSYEQGRADSSLAKREDRQITACLGRLIYLRRSDE